MRRQRVVVSPVQSGQPTRLPKTISTNVISYTASLPLDHLYPITGRYSDIFDHYHVMSDVLGSGKYGNVRECYSRWNGRCFAVKSINKTKVGRLDHLKQEVLNLSRVDHENIVKFVDCFEDATYLHIVTEKYAGELFDQIIENRAKGESFSEAKAARIVKSLLDAVLYLHSRNIVHRDIKPENIIFTHFGDNSDIKLIDFGLSRMHQTGETPMSNAVGTSFYMSPELLKHKYTKSCDVWSVGIVAYILLCGYPPFNGSSDDKIHESILAGNLRFNKGWSDKSQDAKDFISCLLRSDRDRLSASQALNHPWIVKNKINFMEFQL
jgi:serine/threonine protein kinase